MERAKNLLSAFAADTVSLLGQRCIDLLELFVPGWRAFLLKTELSETRQTPSAPEILRLGDLTALTPLTLLALAARVADPPPDGAAFWAHLYASMRKYTALLLKPLLVELLSNFLLQERPFTPKQPPPETGYSSLLIQPQEVIDQVSYPDSITILKWPFAGTRPVAFAEGEIRATPLLASHLQAALCQHGCDLGAIPLTELALSARPANILARGGVSTLEALARQTPEHLFARRNFGAHAYEEVARRLREYLAPWFAQLPPDVLVPAERSHAFGMETEDEAPAPPLKIRYIKIPDPAPQEQKPAPRQGKNALFFPVDAIWGTNAVLAEGEIEANHHASLSADELWGYALLSNRLTDSLAANGCDLMSIPVQELFEGNGESSSTLAVRAHNALIRAKVRSVGELVRRTPAELMGIRNFGVGSYRELVQRLQAYLQPWLDELGLDGAAEDDGSSYEDSSEDSSPVEELLPLEEAEVGLCSADLPGLLDFYAVEWRQTLVADVCHDLQFGALPVGLTLGDVIGSGQISQAMVVATAAVADQMGARIQQALISALVDGVLSAALSAQEQLDYQQMLASVSVESLLAEFIKQYIAFTHKDSARGAPSDLPREIKVLLGRAGVIDGQPKTLAEIGDELGLTRARVQQMEARTEESLQRGPMRSFVDGMALLLKWAIQVAGGVTTIPQAAITIADWLPFGPLDPEATTKLLVRWATHVSVKGDARLVSSPLGPALIKKIEQQIEYILQRYPGGLTLDRLVDEVLLAGDEQIFSAGREFVAAAIRLSDAIEIQEEYCWPRSQGTLRAQLITLLRALGKPAHFTEIAERYNEQFPNEKPRTAPNLHAFLLRFPNLFVRVGSTGWEWHIYPCRAGL